MVDCLLITGTILATLILATVLHELGHAFATSMVGGQVTSVVIGRIGPSITFAVRSVETVVHLVPIEGTTRTVVSTRRQAVAGVNGGPLVNLGVGVGCLLLRPSSGVISVLLTAFGGVNLVFAMLSLAPMPARPPKKLATDGWQLGGLLVGNADIRRKRRALSAAIEANAREHRAPGDGSTSDDEPSQDVYDGTLTAVTAE